MANNNFADLVISTTHGRIRGRENVSIYGDHFYSFERIPFAKPPLAQLRFKAPQPMEEWQEVLDCTQKGTKPLQKNLLTNEIEGSEDCLYLNVYVKKLVSPKPLPVMIFLFGGGFERGDPTRDLHGPDYFMMKDVILVTVSYRVGPLGFLSLTDPTLDIPGNAGLKDQLYALKWLNKNVSNFNGDPTNVTLFGASAGAASTHYMMLTPLAKGLFQKAILMSGVVLCPWALSPLKNLAYRLAKANGYTGDNNEREVFKYLQSLQGDDLVRPHFLTKEENLDDCHFTFGPVIEPYASDNCIIPKSPFELLANAWGNEIPIMMGCTSFEGLLMYARAQMAPHIVTELKDNSEHMLPLELKRKYDLKKQKLLGMKLQEIHFEDKEITLENLLNYCDYASYKVFWHPKLRTIKARLRHSKAPTYLYRFDFDSPDFNHQRIKYCGKKLRGVAHVDDHSYIFYGDFSWKVPKDSLEYQTILRMIDIWTSFAATSNPNCQHLGEKNWEPLKETDEKIHCLNIGEKLEIIKVPELEKLYVWESLYED